MLRKKRDENRLSLALTPPCAADRGDQAVDVSTLSRSSLHHRALPPFSEVSNRQI
jgi:hypothetical protein